MAGILNEETIVGNVSNIYQKRSVGADKKSVIDFIVACTPRKNVDGEWTDGETYWANVTAWGKLADNVEESFRVGDRVFVRGRKDVKAPFKRADGTMTEAKPYIVADFTGLEISVHPAHSDRVAKGNTSTPATAAKPAAKAASSVDDDIFADTSDDLDLSDLEVTDKPPF